MDVRLHRGIPDRPSQAASWFNTTFHLYLNTCLFRARNYTAPGPDAFVTMTRPRVAACAQRLLPAGGRSFNSSIPLRHSRHLPAQSNCWRTRAPPTISWFSPPAIPPGGRVTRAQDASKVGRKEEEEGRNMVLSDVSMLLPMAMCLLPSHLMLV